MIDKKMSIDINKHYQRIQPLLVDKNPFMQFTHWFLEAKAIMPEELVNAMTVATVSQNGQPSARVVLLKQYDHNGFVFFSNYNSRKGQEIDANHFAALLFWWNKMDRQIRIEGQVEKASAAISDEYFRSRSRASQISAIASAQSSVLSDFSQLQQAYDQLSLQYADETTPIPRPANWGGYLVKPHLFEFWEGGLHRLHHRLQYRLIDHEEWQIEQLAP